MKRKPKSVNIKCKKAQPEKIWEYIFVLILIHNLSTSKNLFHDIFFVNIFCFEIYSTLISMLKLIHIFLIIQIHNRKILRVTVLLLHSSFCLFTWWLDCSLLLLLQLFLLLFLVDLDCSINFTNETVSRKESNGTGEQPKCEHHQRRIAEIE